MEGVGGRVPKDNFVRQKGGGGFPNIIKWNLCLNFPEGVRTHRPPPPPPEIPAYSVYNTSYIKSKVTWLKIVNSVDLSYQKNPVATP